VCRVISSRRIEKKVVEDVGFGVLDGGERTGFPDCRTISDFRKLHLAALQGFTFALVGMHQRSKRGQECGQRMPKSGKGHAHF
jgi:hypothetical protein